jgi:hypothetical protein
MVLMHRIYVGVIGQGQAQSECITLVCVAGSQDVEVAAPELQNGRCGNGGKNII